MRKDFRAERNGFPLLPHSWTEKGGSNIWAEKIELGLVSVTNRHLQSLPPLGLFHSPDWLLFSNCTLGRTPTFQQYLLLSFSYHLTSYPRYFCKYLETGALSLLFAVTSLVSGRVTHMRHFTNTSWITSQHLQPPSCWPTQLRGNLWCVSGCTPSCTFLLPSHVPPLDSQTFTISSLDYCKSLLAILLPSIFFLPY